MIKITPCLKKKTVNVKVNQLLHFSDKGDLPTS